MSTLRDNSIESWNQALEDGLEFRRQYGREAEWARCESLFGHANEIQRDNVGPNIIVSTGDALLSSLLTPNPFINVLPRQPQLINATPVLESVLNDFITDLKQKAVVNQMALHAYLYGVGVAKIGYDSEFGYDPTLDIGKSAQTIVGMTTSMFDKKGQRLEYGLGRPGMPWIESVLPHDIVVPWGVGVNLEKTPWIAHRVVRHIDDIKADPKYENKSSLVPQMSMSDWVKSYLTVMKPYRMGRSDSWQLRGDSDKAEYVELWEIRDFRTGRVYVISQGHDKFLRNEIDYMQVIGNPFVALRFVPAPRTFWVTPDVVYLQHPQEEAIDIAAITKKQRRISLLRFAYPEGSMDNDEINNFLSGEIGIAIKYKPEGAINGQQPFQAITPPNSNNQLQNEMEALRRDARETVGFGRNQLGEYESTGRRTATEASVVSNKAEERLDRRQDAIGDCYCEVAKKLAATVFKFWRTPRITQIIGPQGALQWSSFTGPDLKGEYKFSVSFSNEPAVSHQSRKSESLQIYQTFGMDPAVDPLALRSYVIRAWNDPNFSSIFKPGVVGYANVSLLMQGQQMSQLGGAQGQSQPGIPGQGGGVNQPQTSQRGGMSPVPQGGQLGSQVPGSGQGMGQ